MLVEVVAWFALGVGVVASVFISRWFLDHLGITTKLLAVASTEFFDEADKLMKSSEELPDPVLRNLEVMIASMNNGQGSKTLYKLLKVLNSGGSNSVSRDTTLKDSVETMREELRDIFGRAIVAWLNYVTHRHLFYGLAIHAELSKMAAKNRTSEVDKKGTGISILPSFSSDRMAC